MIENGTISISNYSDTLKQQVVSEEECAQEKQLLYFRVGWNITMRGWCCCCHRTRLEAPNWVMDHTSQHLQPTAGETEGPWGAARGLRKVSIYGVLMGVYGWKECEEWIVYIYIYPLISLWFLDEVQGFSLPKRLFGRFVLAETRLRENTTGHEGLRFFMNDSNTPWIQVDRVDDDSTIVLLQICWFRFSSHYLWITNDYSWILYDALLKPSALWSPVTAEARASVIANASAGRSSLPKSWWACGHSAVSGSEKNGARKEREHKKI